MSRGNEPVNIGNPAELTVLAVCPRKSSRPPVRAAKSLSARCRRMIRASGGRTSRGRGVCWAGSRGWRWRRGLSRLLSISGANWGGEARVAAFSRIWRENDGLLAGLSRVKNRNQSAEGRLVAWAGAAATWHVFSWLKIGSSKHLTAAAICSI